VRTGEGRFRDELDSILQRKRSAVDEILRSYGVPRA
jgi:hypothetical protein